MSRHSWLSSPIFNPTGLVAMAILGLSGLIAASLTYRISHDRRDFLSLAKREALSTFNKDQAFRQWATAHGGVYVPVTARTPPNPYLDQIPERDITLPSGKVLTLMNPAYMMRQVMETYHDLFGVKGHLTSRKLLNPINTPDPWERRALEELESGAQEVSAVADLDGESHLRLMLPMVTQRGCLKCHGHQGYREGEVRGAVSVNVPLAPYQAMRDHNLRIAILTHAGAWLIGLSGILLVTVLSRTSVRQREQYLAALQESEERFRGTFEQAAVGIAHVAPDGRWVRVNRKLCEIVGYPREELLQRTFQELTHPDDLDADLALDRQLLAGEIQQYALEKRCICKDGKTVWTNTTVAVMRDPAGAPDYFISVVDDISAKKKIEGEIRRSEAFLQKILASLTHPFYVIDARDHTVVLANTASGVGALPDRPTCYAMSHGRSEPCAVHDCPLEMVKRTRRPVVVEHTHFDEEGKRQVLEIHGYPLFDAEGNVAQMIEYALDVTVKKLLEEDLAQSRKLEGVGQLAGGIAHDFNNILGAVVMCAELLKMKMAAGDPLRNVVEQVLDAGQRGAALTHQLLAFSRKQTLVMREADLNEIVRSLGRLLPRVIREDVAISFVLADGPLPVLADRGQIDQVLINLAANARDAMPDGGDLKISTGVVEVDEAFLHRHGCGAIGHYGTITVSDTGFGMDEKCKKKVFEPFFTTKELGRGTGLGLAVVYGIVSQHKGFIHLESEPGSGTTFTVFLPLLPEGHGHDLMAREEPAAPGGTERILVVEDDPVLLTSMDSMLKLMGYVVVTADDGQEALQRFLEHRDEVDLLLSDLVMPKKNGLAVYDEIKVLSPRVKVLFTTGYSGDELNRGEIVRRGLPLLPKPFTRHDLLVKVREVLDAPPGEPGSAGRGKI